MNSCMIAHAKPIEEDAARAEWFARIHERRRKREEEALMVEQRRKEVIDLTRKQEQKEQMGENHGQWKEVPQWESKKS